jgi:hypothetical protein
MVVQPGQWRANRSRNTAAGTKFLRSTAKIVFTETLHKNPITWGEAKIESSLTNILGYAK